MELYKIDDGARCIYRELRRKFRGDLDKRRSSITTVGGTVEPLLVKRTHSLLPWFEGRVKILTATRCTEMVL